MKKIALLGALALSLLSPLTMAQEAKALRIGIEAAYPPFAYKTPDGNITGFDYDIGVALCKEMQVECKWIEQEFDGLIPALKVRKFDAVLSSMSITEERKRAVAFTGKYYATPAKLAMKSGAVMNDVASDLKGKKIGVQRSSVYDRYATDVFAPAGAEIVRYSSQNEVFLDLSAGRLDGTIADSVNIEDGFLKTDAGKGFAFVGPDFTEQKYFGEGQGIAVRKGDKALAEKISAAILAIRANGTYKAVQDKYFSFDVYGK
ncbi:arginine/ornithine transport system substrate-binding protein [Pseudomonas flavescens]|uniref:Arginine/ornithine transport system substrate-binding protein n=1 Tax=Phytopseudomonas flavescens TaxID=29435 RepID=A0A1G8Q7E5_9GAMM|nr:ABC transporter substrate-binding protein [Pseudomonas flavescens]SDJ00020.1 arginine/ornithine transport system substrate-binding protein [Pseudomonas flavescens]